jgi:Putative adhesin
MPEFECPKPITVSLRAGGGLVDITAEERPTAHVDVSPYDETDASRDIAASTRVEMHGDTLIVTTPEPPGAWLWRRHARVRIAVRVPLDSALALKISTADLVARGRFGLVTLGMAAGDGYVEHITGNANVKTASGDVTIDRVDGTIQVNSASGDVEIGTAMQEVSVHAASGDVRIGRAASSVKVASASGDVDIVSAERGELRLRSASGDVGVGVAPGTGVWLDLNTSAGRARCDLSMPEPPAAPGDADLYLHVRSMSGDITVGRAPSNHPAAA